MPDRDKPPLGMIIAGDDIIDEFFFPRIENETKNKTSESHFSDDQNQYRSRTFGGGVNLVADFLDKVMINHDCQMKIIHDDKKFVTREILERCPQSVSRDRKNEEISCSINVRIYRGKQFLGISEIDEEYSFVPKIPHKSVDPKIIQFIVINDMGEGGFSNNEAKCQNLLKEYRGHKKTIQKVIIKLRPNSDPKIGYEFRQNPDSTYYRFLEDVKQKLVIVVNSRDLRFIGANISYRLSWDKTAEDLLYQLKNNKKLRCLHHCEYLIVRLGLEGALVVEKPYESLKNLTGDLYFDSYSFEDSFFETAEGNIQGLSIAFLAGLIKEIVSSQKNGKIIFSKSAIQAGLNVARYMWFWGYGRNEIPERIPTPLFENLPLTGNVTVSESPATDTTPDRSGIPAVGNPPEHLLSCSLEKECIFYANKNLNKDLSLVKVGLSDFSDPEEGKTWSILKKNREKESIGNIAYNIVTDGINNLRSKDFPILQIGKMVTVDRIEIESYQSIKNIITEYLDSEKNNVPLSIAVFGPAGSGKSFGIREVLRSIQKSEHDPLTFNLSQFTEIKQLISAFHTIRDYSLKKQIPLVFFDEFDCKFNEDELSWLKHFLSPMQDGYFFDGENTHPIGRCIFVFAGSVYPNFEAFREGFVQKNEDLVDEEDVEEDDTDMGDLSANKIPDFISRLRGYIDVLGFDRDEDNDGDESYKLRRAILLRSLMAKNAPHLFSSDHLAIDEDVLRAFIKVARYHHGIRSMQAIIEMSNIMNKKRFEPSSLPSKQQLNLHVNADEFMNLVMRKIHFAEKTEQIRSHILKTHNSSLKYIFPQKPLKQFGKLPKKDQEDIRNQIDQIITNVPRILHNLGYGIVRCDDEEIELIDITVFEDNLNTYLDSDKNKKPEKPEYLILEQKHLDLFRKIPQIMKKVQFRLYLI